MKQPFRKASRRDSIREPSRGSVHWLWFAAARPVVYWFEETPARESHREPKSAQFAHE
jgi:hypothetical protein